MYAVIETGGKQYRVYQGDVIKVEKIKAEIGAKVEFDKVLVVGSNGDVQVGTPYLDAAKVFGNVLEHGKGEKIIIFKYKAKKDYRKKQGHRQPYTMVEIDAISADGSAKPKKAAVKKEEPAAEVVEEADAVIKAAVEDMPVSEKKLEAEDKPEAEKKPAKKAAVKKEEPAAEDKPEAEKKPAKKPAAKKEAAEDKPEAAKKPAAKKAAAEDKPEAEKKPARKPAAKKAEKTEE